MKKCSKCKQEKPLTEFRNDKYSKFGKTTRCKECLSTYKPEEIRCYYCREWFRKKQSNYKFCSSKCHDRYWSRIWRLRPEGFIYMINYHRKYDYSENHKCKDCGGRVSNGSTRCQRCHCLIMSKKAKDYRQNYQMK
jgi:hypothetical protein